MADESFVFVDADLPGNLDHPMDMSVKLEPPQIKSLHVDSNVRNRYSRTIVTSKYSNGAGQAQETTFSIVLPDTAFVAGFVMEIEGKKYEAYVKEKEEAKQIYQAAVNQRQFAARVDVDVRDSNKMTVSVNLKAQSDVTFTLTYEELLIRKHNKYELLINLHPGQLVEDFKVNVHINESRPVINVQTPALKSGNEITEETTNNKYATITKESDKVVHISFNPTINQQKEISNKLSSEGISGQFVVEYDVKRDPSGGEVLINDGYFVHFFAPSDLKPIPKHVVFVLDVSGSMNGRKIEQLREAMKVILNELNPEDYFNIVKFSSTVQLLYSNVSMESKTNISLPATKENISKAQNIVTTMSANGGTNINDALITALSLTLKGISVEDDTKHKPQPIIVFLTDGQANVGEFNPDNIIKNVAIRNDCETPAAIFTLSFGHDANKSFLKELAIKNSGFLRHIYEAADASLQLQDFYKQISSPLLTNVNFKYSEEVKDLTKHKFDILFNGSEFVVTGKVDKVVDGFVVVEGSTLYGINDFRPNIIPICPVKEDSDFGNLERLWAYMTIKQLLDKKYEKKNIENPSSDTPEKQALKLALKYSFVTPVTSLVVVKPEDKEENDLQWGSVSVPSAMPSGFGNVRSKRDGARFRCAPTSLSFGSPCAMSTSSLFGSALSSFAPASSLSFCNYSNLPQLIQLSSNIAQRDLNSVPWGRKINKKRVISNVERQQIGPILIPDPPSLKSLKIDTIIQNNVSRTNIKYKYLNQAACSLQTSFPIFLPKNAIIADFFMEINGTKYNSKRVDLNEAYKIYLEAVRNNLSVAHLNVQDPNKILVPINIEAQSDVTLILIYEQYLTKKNDKYEIPLLFNPGIVIDNLGVNIKIVNNRPIADVGAQVSRSEIGKIDCPYAIINQNIDGSYDIEFKPTVSQQTEMVRILKENERSYIPREFIVEFRVDSSEKEIDCHTISPENHHLIVVKSLTNI